MNFDIAKFFVGFVGGSLLINMLVIPYPVFGSLFIGAMIGILLESSNKSSPSIGSGKI